MMRWRRRTFGPWSVPFLWRCRTPRQVYRKAMDLCDQLDPGLRYAFARDLIGCTCGHGIDDGGHLRSCHVRLAWELRGAQ